MVKKFKERLKTLRGNVIAEITRIVETHEYPANFKENGTYIPAMNDCDDDDMINTIDSVRQSISGGVYVTYHNGFHEDDCLLCHLDIAVLIAILEEMETNVHLFDPTEEDVEDEDEDEED